MIQLRFYLTKNIQDKLPNTTYNDRVMLTIVTAMADVVIPDNIECLCFSRCSSRGKFRARVSFAYGIPSR